MLFPDEKDFIRCWCFNDQGDVLIIGTEKGRLYIANWVQDKMRSFSLSDQAIDEITSISAIWMPSPHICCFDYGLYSIYCFDPQEVIANADKLLSLNVSCDNNNDNNNNTNSN